MVTCAMVTCAQKTARLMANTNESGRDVVHLHTANCLKHHQKRQLRQMQLAVLADSG
jgi:hypothetical protein